VASVITPKAMSESAYNTIPVVAMFFSIEINFC
jgi:hypothetical protein